ncbi:SusC/RagA family TonB-linked outer membrane protein [Aestuariibaculum marinum]|uniref:SusC/RagA family TonB-linked outer membrane protein n=1 Tax=Aestuariibaculum marinum TaxID=2683592 RepID=A0A8J6Q5W0_9FLAO|nr:SusC/RagA family TonB-linked outer membrane protein [Aestuariibaculum marinum]MBD0824934.1 SusC/RagA family TonB-linked outer membrane protein [Aestuariibaculum marinum]
MKLNLHQRRNFCSLKPLQLFVMALALWVVAIQQATAQSVLDKSVTFNVKNVTLTKLFNQLEETANCQFSFSDEILNNKTLFTYSFKSQKLKTVLDKVSQDAQLSYMVNGSTITLTTSKKVKVSGEVKDIQGMPLIGVNVLIKGSQAGVLTDFDGRYTLSVPKNSTLVYTYMGMQDAEKAVNSGGAINVTMEEDVVAIDEVVVTALNISREEKSLGYSVAKVESEEITKTVSGNWLNSLNGKVAGLTFASANSGPSSSIRVTLRGDQSLNYGSNEALFVIDGVPVSSGTTATRSVSNYAQADAPVDYGDGMSDINPDDIESVSVLKGPSAAALYGSRAANGVIMITTKSGRKNKGLGISVNSSVTFEQAGYFPDFQTQYGNGSDMGLNEYSLWNISEEMAPDGIAQNRHYSRYTFGEKFDANKYRYLYASKNWDDNTYTKLPWVYQDDWYTGLFETGVTTNNTVSINGNNGKGTSTRFSVTDFKNEWIMPNTGFKRNTVSFTINTPVSDKIKFNTKVNYYKKKSDNMPVSGYDETNPMYNLVWGFNVNSIQDWKDEYFEGRYNYANWNAGGENGMGLVFPSANSFNPYRTLYESLNTQDKDRVFGNIGLTFDLLKGMILDLRSGVDWSDEFRTMRKAHYTGGVPNGFYREQTVRRLENNNEFMLRYNNEFSEGRFGLSTMVGGNNRKNTYYNYKITLSELGEEGIYHTSNLPTGVNPDFYNYRSEKVVNSLYGLVSLSWDDAYFVDVTARNDWSSTLSRGNWSYFYPSVSASVLLDKTFNFKSNAPWVDMLKARVSWANVGNDTGAYSLDQVYSNTSFPGSYALPGNIPDPLIQPENVESWEAGIEAKLFRNRISFDVTAYHSSTTNQIVSVDTDQIAGATGMTINAGEISNKGLEITANFVPVRTKDFKWDFDVTWSKNKNKLVSLQDGWDPTVPLQTDMGTTIGSRTYVYSYVGEEMHVIYGRGFQRAPEGATYTDENGNEVDASGMHIVNSEGYPVLDNSPTTKIGNVNPDWRAGMVQRFRYKNLSLSATFAGQMGGNAFSVTNFALSYQGKLNNSVEGRYDGLVHPGVNALENTDGTITYTKNNTVANSIQTYYNTYVWNRNNTEMNTFDTSYLKLRELRLDYDLPARILSKLGAFQKISFGAYATNVFCITDFPQYDPDTGMLNGSNIYKGIESMTFPMTRTYGLNVQLSF